MSAGYQGTFSSHTPVAWDGTANYTVKDNDPRAAATDGGRYNRSFRCDTAGTLTFTPIDGGSDQTLTLLAGEYFPVGMKVLKATSTCDGTVLY